MPFAQIVVAVLVGTCAVVVPLARKSLAALVTLSAAAAVATRSCVAYWIPRAATVAPSATPASGRTHRYATFVHT